MGGLSWHSFCLFPGLSINPSPQQPQPQKQQVWEFYRRAAIASYQSPSGAFKHVLNVFKPYVKGLQKAFRHRDYVSGGLNWFYNCFKWFLASPLPLGPPPRPSGEPSLTCQHKKTCVCCLAEKLEVHAQVCAGNN